MINSYNGILVDRNNRHRIRSVHGCVLRRGIYVNGCTDVGRIDNVHFHGCYWWKKIRNSDGSWGKVNQYLMDNLEAFVIGRSDWEYITNTFMFIAKVGYRFIKTGAGASSCQMVGVGADACRTCVLVEGTVSWLELLITNGTFATDSEDKMGVGVQIDENSDRTANGPVRLVNCTILAPRG